MPSNFTRPYLGEWRDSGSPSQAGGQQNQYSGVGAGAGQATQSQITQYHRTMQERAQGHAEIAQRPQEPDLCSILESFVRDFPHGISEIVISKPAYIRLCDQFMRQRALPPISIGNYLAIHTAHGSMIVRPEGSSSHKDIDWNRYMEETDETKLP